MISFALFSFQNILLSGLVMLGVALTLGFLIVIVSTFFQVSQNEKKEALLEALPGANCGGCGFAGCAGYAEYLLKPGADTGLCSPGGAACAREIATILGTVADEPKPQVVVLLCQGAQDQTSPRYQYHGTQSCSAAHGLLGGPGSCTYGCLGFGDCIAACAFGALKIRDGIIQVDSFECTGCGACTKVCPKNLLRIIPVTASVEVRCRNEWPGGLTRKNCHIGCIGCGRCVKVCPTGAISLKGPLAHLDQTLCINCGACAEVCPTKSIEKRQ
jgi:Na+-translocating ferredoxin:NAD+ oxidoreductase RNF subunit RnfB